jgi:hypothetical protein
LQRIKEIHAALDHLESSSNEKFTEAQYISLSHLPSVSSTDSKSSKKKKVDKDDLYK